MLIDHGQDPLQEDLLFGTYPDVGRSHKNLAPEVLSQLGPGLNEVMDSG